MTDDPLGIDTFLNGFHVGGFNVWQVFLNILTTQIMSHGITAVFGSADINKSDLGFTGIFSRWRYLFSAVAEEQGD